MRDARARARQLAWAQLAEARGGLPQTTAAGQSVPGLVLDLDASIVLCHSDTTGEVLLARADMSQAETAFQAAIAIAEEHRLPHQIQRSLRACTSHLPAVEELARQSLERLRIPAPGPAVTQAP